MLRNHLFVSIATLSPPGRRQRSAGILFPKSLGILPSWGARGGEGGGIQPAVSRASQQPFSLSLGPPSLPIDILATRGLGGRWGKGRGLSADGFLFSQQPLWPWGAHWSSRIGCRGLSSVTKGALGYTTGGHPPPSCASTLIRKHQRGCGGLSRGTVCPFSLHFFPGRASTEGGVEGCHMPQTLSLRYEEFVRSVKSPILTLPLCSPSFFLFFSPLSSSFFCNLFSACPALNHNPFAFLFSGASPALRSDPRTAAEGPPTRRGRTELPASSTWGPPSSVAPAAPTPSLGATTSVWRSRPDPSGSGRRGKVAWDLLGGFGQPRAPATPTLTPTLTSIGLNRVGSLHDIEMDFGDLHFQASL